ncbi:MAG: NAD(P)(+) transhydrogenase (Re/Si-specific) subunit beta [Saprospiraceae bacterium]|jgi:NAD(P) transhydrogenase subunit beta|uniref:NAD(P)(+) transhydrogenase (Re/Si-specific) subunit beta n=1 Tax=Candidatus Brachybacter algidus TaxID=2982024 RepID=UPI001B6C16F7|nr:NAD(P)(+) transhydrogenase (Re/Si-specific) subunit beta [Candidatus Brachybacter algidus]MBP7304532.1 NAD(P)(+) transhydrogenase (Re/Si-specific) subunit beta [Saprospiraceae bacterium]MBK6450216.1 NAD(P)(+) transhydrogenase (Re/Si-specific) subunit beta [Candidatus Brachybacter algidus]MBK7603203.1 NAD(P)(+) transhydrogenase (Re/Si-specific) subunit beta [Candidatus Brachybacter algidus]MBK8356601.1 NAD(P)(+) transhydrogenase (Re/Si-specific) subunit beta [Candidatus Brachybacter algidus]
MLLVPIYIVSSVSFILGLKMLSHPATARNGNLAAAAGMALAIFATIFMYIDPETGQGLNNYGWIFSGLILGSIVGTLAAKRVQMTAMPEMVSLFNGMGGACAALISLIEYQHLSHLDITSISGQKGMILIIVLGLIIGSVSFAGSMIAYGKLNGKIGDFSFKGQNILSIILLLIIIGLAVSLVMDPGQPMLFYVIFVLSLLYGAFFVFPIGGADMPVVISLLNSFTGVAAAFGGFLYDNKVMLTGGILVGAAGTLLTILMCKAMNRSLLNVLIGNFGGNASSSGGTSEMGSYKEVSLSDAAVQMAYANRVIIVPGYGLAVAQAQHVCHELEGILEERGVEVTYAIHPVAGRMPGHMNVLLAEADVSYDKLEEMEKANDDFPKTDVVLILGANDVVNPAAKTDPTSPIYGMPILEVEKAKSVIVNKRSMKPGYAGIENALFFQPKTSMLFGDAKKVLQELVAELKTI